MREFSPKTTNVLKRIRQVVTGLVVTIVAACSFVMFGITDTYRHYDYRTVTFGYPWGKIGVRFIGTDRTIKDGVYERTTPYEVIFYVDLDRKPRYASGDSCIAELQSLSIVNIANRAAVLSAANQRDVFRDGKFNSGSAGFYLKNADLRHGESYVFDAVVSIPQPCGDGGALPVHFALEEDYREEKRNLAQQM